MSDQQAPDSQALMMEFEAVQQRLRQLDQHLATLEAQAAEARRALSTLEALDANQSGLVPIGGGFHIRATLHGDQPVVAPVGSGYAADQDLDSAKKLLSDRSNSIQERLSKSEQEANRLASLAQQMAGQIQSLQQESEA